MRDYPDVANIVRSIAMSEAQAVDETIRGKLEQIQQREIENTRREAALKLAQVHPDFFDDIRNREEFHEWLRSKSKRIQDAIYGDDYDADAAIDVVSMYK